MRNSFSNWIVFTIVVINSLLFSKSYGQGDPLIAIRKDIAVMCLQIAEENNLLKERLIEKENKIIVKDSLIREKDAQLESAKREILSWERTESVNSEKLFLKDVEISNLEEVNKHLRRQNLGLKIVGAVIVAAKIVSLFL